MGRKRHLVSAGLIILLAIGTVDAGVVVLSSSRLGPTLITGADGLTVQNGLMRMGALLAPPASESVEDIEAVFLEFGTSSTNHNGLMGSPFYNPSSSAFDYLQIYVWVFSGDSVENSTEHGLITVVDPDNPSAGDPWKFDPDNGGVSEQVISLFALFDGGGDRTVPAPVYYDSSGNRRIILTIPEPSAPILSFCASVLLFRRRR